MNNDKMREAFDAELQEWTGDHRKAVEHFAECVLSRLQSQQPESEPIAYISKIAIEELQKPECSEDMFGVTGTPSGRWDVGLFLDPPPTVQVPEGWRIEHTGRYDRILVYPHAREEMPIEISPGSGDLAYGHLYMLCEDLLATSSIAEKDDD